MQETKVWIAFAVVAVGLVLMAWLNLRTWQQSKRMLDGRRAVLSARIVWAASIFSAWTGPLVTFFALLTALFALYVVQKKYNPRSVLYGKTAIKNGVILTSIAFALVMLLTR